MLRPRLAIAALVTVVAAAGGVTAGVVSSHRTATAAPTTVRSTVTTGQPVPVATTAASATAAGRASATTKATTGRVSGVTVTTGASAGPPRLSDPAQAANRLFAAWQRGNRGLALLVASPSAVRALFAIPPAPRPRFSGCRSRDLGFDCQYGYTDADGVLFIDMRVEGGASAGYRVVSIEAPLRFSHPASSAKHLVDAWRADDRAAALQAASRPAVDAIFRLADRANPPRPLGCAFRDNGFDCAYTGDGGRLVMRLEGGASAGWVVTAVREVSD